MRTLILTTECRTACIEGLAIHGCDALRRLAEQDLGVMTEFGRRVRPGVARKPGDDRHDKDEKHRPQHGMAEPLPDRCGPPHGDPVVEERDAAASPELGDETKLAPTKATIGGQHRETAVVEPAFVGGIEGIHLGQHRAAADIVQRDPSEFVPLVLGRRNPVHQMAQMVAFGGRHGVVRPDRRNADLEEQDVLVPQPRRLAIVVGWVGDLHCS